MDSGVIVGFTGITCAGKSTIINRLKGELILGKKVIVANDYLLRWLPDGFLSLPYVSDLVLHITTFPFFIYSLFDKPQKIILVLKALRGMKEGLLNKINILRNYIKAEGIEKRLSMLSNSNNIYVFDEPSAHLMHALFVSYSEVNLSKKEISTYNELHVDGAILYICLKGNRDVIYERFFNRGHKRLSSKSIVEKRMFLNNAYRLFEYLSTINQGLPNFRILETTGGEDLIRLDQNCIKLIDTYIQNTII